MISAALLTCAALGDLDALRLNQLQLRGTHNSYHQRPALVLHATHDYQQPSLTDQLTIHGIRQFELDVHLSAEGSFEVDAGTVDAEGMQLQDFPRQVLVEPEPPRRGSGTSGQRRIGAHRRCIVEIEQHGRMLLDAQQHGRKATRHIGPDGLALEGPGQQLYAAAVGGHGEVVAPEHHPAFQHRGTRQALLSCPSLSFRLHIARQRDLHGSMVEQTCARNPGGAW